MVDIFGQFVDFLGLALFLGIAFGLILVFFKNRF